MCRENQISASSILFRLGLSLLVCLAFVSSGYADKPAAADDASPALAEPVEGSMVYKQVGDRKLRIDYTRPAEDAGDSPRAAVVFFHGGGWVGGKPGQFLEHSKELAARGVVCFRVEYRLLKGTPKNTPPITCTEDVSDAFRYIRGHADELGIDPNRIAAGGGSAGGHLAAYLGMLDDEVRDGVSRKPNALVLFNPVYDNRPGQWGNGRVGDQVQRFSPSENITADDPPAIVFLGTSDSLVPIATAERFQKAMQDAGQRSELHRYKGQKHGFFNYKKQPGGGENYRDTTDKSIAFLDSLGWFDQAN